MKTKPPYNETKPLHPSSVTATYACVCVQQRSVTKPLYNETKPLHRYLLLAEAAMRALNVTRLVVDIQGTHFTCINSTKVQILTRAWWWTYTRPKRRVLATVEGGLFGAAALAGLSRVKRVKEEK